MVAVVVVVVFAFLLFKDISASRARSLFPIDQVSWLHTTQIKCNYKGASARRADAALRLRAEMVEDVGRSSP